MLSIPWVQMDKEFYASTWRSDLWKFFPCVDIFNNLKKCWRFLGSSQWLPNVFLGSGQWLPNVFYACYIKVYYKNNRIVHHWMLHRNWANILSLQWYLSLYPHLLHILKHPKAMNFLFNPWENESGYSGQNKVLLFRVFVDFVCYLCLK